MPRPSREQWDALAAFWERFEADGLRPEHLDEAAGRLESPCVVVGSGLGLLCEALTTSGLESVIGVDFSPAMVERSRSLRGVEAVVASADRLPFADAAIGSVVVATGVLDPSDRHAVSRIWAELGRVVRPGGMVLAGFFDAGAGLRAFLDGSGILDEDGMHRTDRIVELWRLGESSEQIAARLALWAQTDLGRAQAVLQRIRPFVDGWSDSLDGTAEHLRQAGLEAPEAHLARCLDWGQPALDDPEDAFAGADAWFEHAEVRRFERESITVFELTRG
jgi:SAM-dependent methyltransferase